MTAKNSFRVNDVSVCSQVKDWVERSFSLAVLCFYWLHLPFQPTPNFQRRYLLLLCAHAAILLYSCDTKEKKKKVKLEKRKKGKKKEDEKRKKTYP